jgi:hypothetical protein
MGVTDMNGCLPLGRGQPFSDQMKSRVAAQGLLQDLGTSGLGFDRNDPRPKLQKRLGSVSHICSDVKAQITRPYKGPVEVHHTAQPLAGSFPAASVFLRFPIVPVDFSNSSRNIFNHSISI